MNGQQSTVATIKSVVFNQVNMQNIVQLKNYITYHIQVRIQLFIFCNIITNSREKYQIVKSTQKATCRNLMRFKVPLTSVPLNRHNWQQITWQPETWRLRSIHLAYRAQGPATARRGIERQCSKQHSIYLFPVLKVRDHLKGLGQLS